MKARLTGFMEKFIPALDKLKHIYISILGCTGYLPTICIGINCAWYYLLWAAASGYNELHQKITKTGQASFKDWCWGMLAPSIMLVIIELYKLYLHV